VALQLGNEERLRWPLEVCRRAAARQVVDDYPDRPQVRLNCSRPRRPAVTFLPLNKYPRSASSSRRQSARLSGLGAGRAAQPLVGVRDWWAARWS